MFLCLEENQSCIPKTHTSVWDCVPQRTCGKVRLVWRDEPWGQWWGRSISRHLSKLLLLLTASWSRQCSHLKPAPTIILKYKWWKCMYHVPSPPACALWLLLVMPWSFIWPVNPDSNDQPFFFCSVGVGGLELLNELQHASRPNYNAAKLSARWANPWIRPSWGPAMGVCPRQVRVGSLARLHQRLLLW